MELRLLPGVRGSEARTALQVVENARTRVQAVPHAQIVEMKRRYNEWAFEAARTLRPYLPRDEIDRLIFTPMFREIQAHNGTEDRSLFIPILNYELDDRHKDLSRTLEEMDSELARWHSAQRIFLLDTGVYLRYKDLFEDIDWRSLTGIPDDTWLTVIIPMAVVDELDRRKKDGNGFLRWRAMYATARVAEIFKEGEAFRPQKAISRHKIWSGDGYEPKVWLELALDAAHHKRLPITDDEIVAQAANIQSFIGKQVTVISFDSGMILRARAANLGVKHLREDDMAPELQSPTHKPREQKDYETRIEMP